jgi:enoyl-CoA hydratase
MAYETIRIETDGPVTTITIDRPKALNALSSQVMRELDDAAANLAPGTRVVIFTGAGEKAFVAGADIAEMRGKTVADAEAFSQVGHALGRRIEALDAVTIAAVNGFALGGGCELAMCCDLIYAAEHARFGQPEVNLGIIPGFGGTQRLPRLVGPQLAKELIFTGDMIDAQTAKAIGLVAAVLPKEELLAHARKVAAKIVAKGPLAIAAAKHLVKRGAALDLDAANQLEAKAFGQLFTSKDTLEGMSAFVEKRAAKFVGA